MEVAVYNLIAIDFHRHLKLSRYYDEGNEISTFTNYLKTLSFEGI